MKFLKLAVLEVVILIGSAALAQTPPAAPVAKPSAPQLKPEVALELTQLQNSLLRLSSQIQALQVQYQDTKKKFDEAQASFFTQQASALKRSGIDDTKYVLNPDSLQVTEKPEAPKAPVTEKK